MRDFRCSNVVVYPSDSSKCEVNVLIETPAGTLTFWMRFMSKRLKFIKALSAAEPARTKIQLHEYMKFARIDDRGHFERS